MIGVDKASGKQRLKGGIQHQMNIVCGHQTALFLIRPRHLSTTIRILHIVFVHAKIGVSSKHGRVQPNRVDRFGEKEYFSRFGGSGNTTTWSLGLGALDGQRFGCKELDHHSDKVLAIAGTEKYDGVARFEGFVWLNL